MKKLLIVAIMVFAVIGVGSQMHSDINHSALFDNRVLGSN